MEARSILYTRRQSSQACSSSSGRSSSRPFLHCTRYVSTKLPHFFLQKVHTYHQQQRIYYGIIFYNLTIMLLKVGILLDWLDLFAPTALGKRRRNSAMFWVCHILIVVVVITYSTSTLLNIFQCTPREKAWLGPLVPGDCPVNLRATSLSGVIVNVITDLAILVLPLRAVWKLNLSMKRKAGVSLLFLIGILLVQTSSLPTAFWIPTNTSFHAAPASQESCAW